MKRIASIIVNSNKILLVVFGLVLVYCIFSIPKVNIEYSITKYLPAHTDTKRGLEIMDQEFTTYGSSTLMIRNISFTKAKELATTIKAISGVKGLPFENTRDYYKDSCALFSITFGSDVDDEVSQAAYYEVLHVIEPYDVFISNSLIDTYAGDLQEDIQFILIIAVIIIIAVLMLTSNSFAEVVVFLLVFGIAAIMNMGTNFWFGKISFISNSVCIILQLALAIDYAIILSHRYAEERALISDNKQAMREALSKAIPEIFGSSLTTIFGLLALTCMSLRLGADLGFVLAKSIACSMLTVFLLMPALLLAFSAPIQKTTHRSFVPNIAFWGKGIVKVRFIIPLLFLIMVILGAVLSTNIEYSYSSNNIDTAKPSETMVAQSEIKKVFGIKNQFVILVPYQDYETEKQVIAALKKEALITDILGISHVSMMINDNKTYLTEKLSYKEFAHILELDQVAAKLIYGSYAYFSKMESKDGLMEVAVFEANPEIYYVSLLQLVDCALAKNDFIYAALSNDAAALNDYLGIKELIEDAEKQLIGINYTRVIFNINADEESNETFRLIDRMQENIKGICPEIIFTGNSMSAYDLDTAFSRDNLLITCLTILFVYLVLVITNHSFVIPILLVLTIQGAIFINFAFPNLMGTNIFFFVYLIVSSIQMGATVDYAIVITNRFEEMRQTMDKKTAVIQAINRSFPTILTSGTILTVAAFLIYFLVSDPLISTLGLALGRGSLISILSVMTFLPAMLYFLGDFLQKTKLPKFTLKSLKQFFKTTHEKEDIKNETNK